MQSRWFIAPFFVFGLACSDLAGPGTVGPAFVAVTVDGKPLTVDDSSGIITTAFTPDEVLSIFAGTGLVSDTARALGLQVNQFRGVGTYRLANMGSSASPAVGSAYYEVYAHPSIELVSAFQTSSVYTGEVRVTGFDPANHVIAGTFAFTAVEVEGTRILHVTNGAFRIRVP